MPHQVRCACGKVFSIRDGFEGRKVLCPGCKAPHVVPRPATAAPAPLVLALPERVFSPVPKRPCPQCREVSPVGPPTCPSCGFLFDAGRELRARAVRIEKEEEDRPPGFLQLGAGMFLHPFSTMENLLYHAGRPDLMIKILLFFLATIPMAGYLQAGGQTSRLAQGCGVVLLEFVVSAGCVLMIGRLIVQGGTFLGAIVAMAFARGFVFILAGGLIVATWAGIAPLGAVATYLFVLWIATIVLNVLTIMSIFACEVTTAILISIFAGIIQNFGLRMMGFR